MAAAWLAAGAMCCALAIAAGAFGAHGLKERLDVTALAQWETAARYLIYSGFGVIAAALAALHEPRRGFVIAAGLLLAGGLVFSLAVAGLAVGGPRWLGAIAPLGGSLLIAGFVVFAATAWRL